MYLDRIEQLHAEFFLFIISSECLKDLETAKAIQIIILQKKEFFCKKLMGMAHCRTIKLNNIFRSVCVMLQ